MEPYLRRTASTGRQKCSRCRSMSDGASSRGIPRRASLRVPRVLRCLRRSMLDQSNGQRVHSTAPSSILVWVIAPSGPRHRSGHPRHGAMVKKIGGSWRRRAQATPATSWLARQRGSPLRFGSAISSYAIRATSRARASFCVGDSMARRRSRRERRTARWPWLRVEPR